MPFLRTIVPNTCGVVQILDKLRQDFFLAMKQDKKGMPSGKMETSDHRKKQGGLGIKNLKNLSKA